jgi:DNA-binding SARP family transcriptional activator
MGDERLRVAILGRVRILTGGRAVAVPRAQTRGVLGLLALRPGQALSNDAIAEALWAGAAPAKARAQVHSAISAIRGVLTGAGFPEALDSNRFGYRLALTASEVDLGEFGGGVSA